MGDNGVGGAQLCAKPKVLNNDQYFEQGVMGSWLGVMVNNFRPLGISDEIIGQIGLFSVISQCSCSIAIGFFTDRFVIRNFDRLLILFELG